MRLITLGPRGTFSEEAAKQYLRRIAANDHMEILFSTISGSLRAVARLEADKAIVPAENMLDGIIGTTFDSLIDFHDSVKICDEIHLPVDLVLAADAGVELNDLKTILSHASPLSQCINNLTQRAPQAFHQPVESTSVAAQTVKGKPGYAAICSRKTAEEHGLEVLESEICDYPHNETRFLVCGLSDAPPTSNDRTMLAVRFGSNQPGQLHDVTGIMAVHGIDLCYVQSRPYKVRPQEYVLLFEFIGHKNDPKVEHALQQIESLVRRSDGWKKVLGSFPRRAKGV